MKNDTPQPDKLATLREENRSILPSDLGRQMLAWLDEAGMGKPGSPYGNTLTGMVQQICEENRQMREAIKEAHAVLKSDALWAFEDADPPFELQATWRNGKGSLTQGPNNCRRFHNERSAALSKLTPYLP